MGRIQERADAYKQAIKEMDIFDISLWWAPQSVDTFVPYTDWEKQVADWHAAGIDGGIVTSQSSMTEDPFIGNEEIVKLVEGKEDLYACIVLVPEMFFDDLKGAEYLKRMKAMGAVAARIYPGRYMHSMQEYVIGPMLRALERENIPLMLWHIDTGWDVMDRICAAHPNLKVIVDSMDRKLLYHARDYMSLMKKYPNFYMDTYNLVLFREYENICEIDGYQHLMYASYFPFMNVDFSMYPIYAAEITDEGKKGIFADNARKLFGV
jgi:predicted TIM-barrel fold metal-dependent hydrolase